MEEQKDGRIPFWDILKGLGIVAVVMGHDGILSREVNWYHLVLFIFVSGALFRPEKAMDFPRYFFHKVKTVWIPFCKYNVAAVLLTNVLLMIGFYTTQAIPRAYQCNWYDKYEIIIHCFQVILTGEVAPLTGPSWFIVPFFMNLMIVGGVVYFFRRTRTRIAVGSVLFLLGYTLVRHHIGLPYNFAIAMMYLPFHFWGMCYRKVYVTSHRTILAVLLGAASIAVLYYCEIKGIVISWGSTKVPSLPLFAAVTASGIFINIILGGVILRIEYLRDLFSLLGRNSFHIMALHLLGFKIPILMSCMLSGDFTLLSSYAGGSYTLMGAFCLVFGLFVPIVIVKLGQGMIRLLCLADLQSKCNVLEK